jgi:hypothetical protein
MNVSLHLHTNARKPGHVYANLKNEAGETVIAADFEYCTKAAVERGYTITNKVEVFDWIVANAKVQTETSFTISAD